MTKTPDPAALRLSPQSIPDAWFRAVADCTCDWESWHGPDGALIWVNPAVERIMGYTVDECLRMTDYPLQMVDPSDHPTIHRMLREGNAGNPNYDVEFQAVHRNGQRLFMAVSWQPMQCETGSNLGFRTSIRDVTERRHLRDQIRLHVEHLEQLVQERTVRIQQLEQHRRQMEKLAALGQLAAGVAHEVNNPLAGIRNAFELIKADLFPEHPHHRLLELIDGEIERISSIVHQMYQLYRRNPQRATAFQLERAVEEVCSLLDGVARRQNVTLVRNSPARPTEVVLPEGEIKQILYNLIRNATQASAPGGDVNISIIAPADSDHVRLEIVDRGPGIPDDVLPRIFDPFFSTKGPDAKGGMGLGLSVTRSLVESLGGRIDVETQAGAGSTFQVDLPRRYVTAEHDDE